MEDIATGKEDSRSLNKEEDIRDYAQKIKDYAGVKSTGEWKPLESLFLPQQEERRAAARHLREHAAKKRSIRRILGLFRASAIPFKLQGAYSLKRFYDELKSLPVASYSNASALLLRVVLDKACRHFLKRKRVHKITIGSKTNKLADTSLGDILDYLMAKSNPLIEDENIKKALRTFKNSSSFRSLSTLNSIVHNEELSFTEQQVRDLLPNLEGFLKMLLTE